MAKGSVKLSIYSTFKDDGTKKAEKALQQFAKKYGELNRETGKMELDATTAQLAQQSVAFDQLSAKLSTYAAGLDKAAKAIAPFSAAAAGMVTASVKLASDYETGLAKVATITDKSAMSMQEMGQKLLDLSNTSGKAVTELEEAAYQAQSASVATQDTVEFVGTAVNLAKTGFTATATAVDVLTTTINAYGMSAADAAAISDKLVQTQNKGKTTVDELAASIGTAIPTAAAYGVSLDNLLTGYVQLTKQGINTANATTALNGMMTELADTGSQVSSVLVQQTGKAFNELMADGATLGDIMGVLRDSVDGDSTAFANLWGNVRASKGALAIANAGTADFNAQMAAMAQSAGNVSAALEDLKTPAGMANKAINSLKNTGILLGEEVLADVVPALASAVEGAKSLYEGFRDLDDGTKQLIKGALLVTAAAAPALKLGSAALTLAANGSKTLANMTANLAKLAAQGKISANAAGLLSKALSGPVLGGVAAATAVVTAGVVAFQNYRRKVDDARTATAGLEKATAASAISVRGAAADLSQFGVASARAKVDIDKLTQSQAELARAIEKRNADAQTSINRLEGARQAIAEYANKTGLTAQQQGKLRDAVAKVNRECGTQYEVVDAANGVIRDEAGAVLETTAAIDQYIAKKQEQIRLDALSETLTDLYKQKEEAIKGLASAQEAYNAAMQASSTVNPYEDTSAGDAARLQQANAQLQQAQSLVSSVNASISSTETQLGSVQAVVAGTAVSVSELANTKVEITAYLPSEDLEAFRGQLEQTGISTQAFNSMTSDQLLALAANYDGTTQSIIATLSSFGVQGAADMAASTGEMVEAAEDAAADGDLTQSGYNMGAGFVAGMDKWVGAAASKAAEMVRAAKNAADAEADSHSPSREMGKRGVWFGQGYEGGIERETPNVAQASRNMVAAAMNAADQRPNAAGMRAAIPAQMQTQTQTVNIYIDGARVNDDAAISARFYENMRELFALNRMKAVR